MKGIFGRRLKERRELKGLRQEDLAQAINSTKSTISQYESGKREPDLSNLAIIASQLSTTTDWLLGLTDDPEISSKPSLDDDIDLDNIRIAAHDEGSEPIIEEEESKLKKLIREVIMEVREERRKEEEEKKLGENNDR
ncbi:MAG: helix-turn-helix transcriptional regulator [Desulfitobacteriaceae bacterium]|jgi:transcriptional regulator with XRE-family HTH domain|nr:helix-turn-helix transcriptional regulator [Desulfitobacteriaceae bacterium]